MIVLNRYKTSEENLTHQVHGVINVYENDEVVYRCSTLERKWFPERKSWSCLPPAPGEQCQYQLEKHNTFGNTKYQHLVIVEAGKRWKIRPEKEAVLYVGQNLVYCEETELYEFTDFRNTLLQLMKHIKDDSKLSIRWSDDINIVGSGYKTKSCFYEDNSLPTYPTLQE